MIIFQTDHFIPKEIFLLLNFNRIACSPYELNFVGEKYLVDQIALHF